MLVSQYEEILVINWTLVSIIRYFHSPGGLIGGGSAMKTDNFSRVR